MQRIAICSVPRERMNHTKLARENMVICGKVVEWVELPTS